MNLGFFCPLRTVLESTLLSPTILILGLDLKKEGSTAY
jgi:hypothetical protein